MSCFRGQEKFQSDPDSYNGAVRENYSWSQDYTDVEVRVVVPKTVVKGRQVNTVCSTASHVGREHRSHFSDCLTLVVSSGQS